MLEDESWFVYTKDNIFSLHINATTKLVFSFIFFSEERVVNMSELTFGKYMKQTVKTDKVLKKNIVVYLNHLELAQKDM